MKKLFTLCLFFAYCNVHAQQIAGKPVAEYISKMGTRLQKGDTLTFGLGRREDGSFKYINIGPNMMASQGMALPRSWAGLRAPVREIKQTVLGRGAGTRTVAVFKAGIYNAALEIDSAEETGEILTSNNQKKTTPAATGIADELLKMKQLLDAGAITQAEFDSQKAKLLNK